MSSESVSSLSFNGAPVSDVDAEANVTLWSGTRTTRDREMEEITRLDDQLQALAEREAGGAQGTATLAPTSTQGITEGPQQDVAPAPQRAIPREVADASRKGATC